MIISEEEARLRLESPNNLANKLKVDIKPLHSNRNGRGNIPPMVQTLAVALGEIDTQAAAAKAFNMTPANASYLTREGKHVDRDFVKAKVHTAHNNALDAMLQSINLLGPKLEHVKKATDLSKIASDMASVVNKTTPQQAQQTNLVVVAYAPRMKEESEFEELVTVNVP